MTGSLGGFETINSLNTTNVMKNYMDIYKDNAKDIKTPEDFNITAQNTLLKGNISKTAMEDPELANDLAVLTGVNNSKPDLSADKAVKTFSKVIGNYVGDVNSKQKAAEDAVTTFSTGGKIDLHDVMIAMEKSSLAMNLTLQLRNKILQAYQEVSKMQV